MKPINKLKHRFNQIKNHPISRHHKLKALSNYIYYNLISSSDSSKQYNWIDKLKFYAEKGSAGIVGNIYFGLYEYYESMFILHSLRENDVFMDIGANVGHYSLLASGLSGANSIAIEPVPQTFERLLKNIELNGLSSKITSLNIGVGNQESELYFSTDKNTMNKVVAKEYKHSIKVPIQMIDSIPNSELTTIIKIDVEGYEKFAFEGAKKTLNNPNLKAIIAELNNSGKGYGVEDIDLYNMLLDYGFRAFTYDPQNRRLTKLEDYNRSQFNTVFIRDLEFITKRIQDAPLVKIWGQKV